MSRPIHLTFFMITILIRLIESVNIKSGETKGQSIMPWRYWHKSDSQLHWDHNATDNMGIVLQLNQVVKVPDNITLYKIYMSTW